MCRSHFFEKTATADITSRKNYGRITYNNTILVLCVRGILSMAGGFSHHDFLSVEPNPNITYAHCAYENSTNYSNQIIIIINTF
jgi:hypothetical protein